MTAAPAAAATAADIAPSAAAPAIATLDDAERALAGDRPAEEVLAALRRLAPEFAVPSRERARLLTAQAIAENRLGFPDQALGDLYEARRLGEQLGDAGLLSRVWRMIGLVRAWAGDGREGASALLQAIAAAVEAGDNEALALGLLEAGRLECEIGRPGDGRALLARGLALGGAALSPAERIRAELRLAEARLAGEDTEGCRTQLTALVIPAGLPLRLTHYRDLLVARIAMRDRDFAAARDLLGRIAARFDDAPDAFERTEHDEVAGELALAAGDAAAAIPLYERVLRRFSDDKLAGREVAARLALADALDRAGRAEEAERTLLEGLRRAVEHGLSGFADQVRARLSESGRSADGWLPDRPLPAAPEFDANRRFVRRRRLGAGGSATVESAFDLELGVEVALKRIALSRITSPKERAHRLACARAEVMSASRLLHPGVARVRAMLIDGGGDALVVQDLVEGTSLRDALAAGLDPGGGLAILADLAAALAALHAAGVTHSDVKPDNVILRDGHTPVLIDFGSSLLGAEPALGRESTPGYSAPELVAGKPVDAAVDLYSLGAVAFELFAGKPPPVEAAPRGLLRGWRAARQVAHRRSALVSGDAADGTARLIAALLDPRPQRRPAAAAAMTAFRKAAAAG